MYSSSIELWRWTKLEYLLYYRHWCAHIRWHSYLFPDAICHRSQHYKWQRVRSKMEHNILFTIYLFVAVNILKWLIKRRIDCRIGSCPISFEFMTPFEMHSHRIMCVCRARQINPFDRLPINAAKLICWTNGVTEENKSVLWCWQSRRQI